MSRWTCPQCDRDFGKTNQSHVCIPGCTVEETFAGRPEYQLESYERIAEHLRTLGPLHEDAVTVGVFLLAERKFAEIRPKARSLEVMLVLPEAPESSRVSRILDRKPSRVWFSVKVTEPDQVDEELLSWLSAAYLDAE